jgi:hypothetical protein
MKLLASDVQYSQKRDRLIMVQINVFPHYSGFYDGCLQTKNDKMVANSFFVAEIKL